MRQMMRASWKRWSRASIYRTLGTEESDERELDIAEAQLRSAGCGCVRPLVGYRHGRGGWTPRCRVCNTVALLVQEKER
jgi:hypothetical protein